MLKTCHIIVTHMHAVVQFVTHSWSCLILSQQRNSPAQQPWGENRHRFYSSSHNVIRAKHEEHASISCCWSCGSTSIEISSFLSLPRRRIRFSQMLACASLCRKWAYPRRIIRPWRSGSLGQADGQLGLLTWARNRATRWSVVTIDNRLRKLFLLSRHQPRQNWKWQDWWTCCKSYSEDLKGRSSHNSLGQ